MNSNLTSSSSSLILQRLWQISRIVVMVVLLYLVLINIDYQQLIERLPQIRLEWQLIAFLMVISALLISTFRWQQLLKIQKITLQYKQLLLYYFRAQFYLMVVPSFIGADVSRTLEVRQSTGKSTEGFSTILIERVISLHVIITMGTLAIWFSSEVLANNLLRFVVTSLFLGITVTLFLLIYTDLIGRVAHWVRIPRLQNLIINLQTNLGVYRNHILQLGFVWSVSILVHLCLVLWIFFNFNRFIILE